MKRTYAADWIVPVSAPSFSDGAVVTEFERIIFVGSRAAAADLGGDVVDLGSAAILPGLVNSHSHLELTCMRGLLEGLQFREWIAKLTAMRARLPNEALSISALAGASEAIRAGVTTLSDTGDSAAPFDALRKAGLRGIAYREVFGPDPTRARASLKSLAEKVDEMKPRETELVKVGVSPHAPYTVSAELFGLVADYARENDLDVCIHCAESEAEKQMMTRGDGDFAAALRARGIEWKAPGLSTIRYLAELGVLDAGPLLVHCVTANSEDIGLIARSGARVAHCPKSNAKLGHGIAPYSGMRDGGVLVGLGTDSAASNNRIDMLEEARFCGLAHRAKTRRFDSPSASELIRLATLGGAEALGLRDKIGSLESGKQADLVGIDLSRPHCRPVTDPESSLIFSAEASDVVLTVVAGRPLFQNGSLTAIDEMELLRQASTVARDLLGMLD